MDTKLWKKMWLSERKNGKKIKIKKPNKTEGKEIPFV